MSYVPGHYRSWSPPGAFLEEDLDYLAAPFADPAKLRASFGTYESLVDPQKRTGRSMITSNDTPTLIIEAMSDPCRYPAFGKRAAIVFPRHVGPFGVVDAGHFPQWEAPELMNDAIAMFCADRLSARSWQSRVYGLDNRDSRHNSESRDQSAPDRADNGPGSTGMI
jgi:pimeloyl-ACP methyl ester carboxylesterase